MDLIKCLSLAIFLLSIGVQPLLAQEVVAVVDFQEVAGDEIVYETITIDRSLSGIVSECECLGARIIGSAAKKPVEVEISFNSKGYSGPIEQRIIFIDDEDEIFAVVVKMDVKR
jgi:hypothetical protein